MNNGKNIISYNLYINLSNVSEPHVYK